MSTIERTPQEWRDEARREGGQKIGRINRARRIARHTGIRLFIARHPELTQRAVAKALLISERTVNRALQGAR